MRAKLISIFINVLVLCVIAQAQQLKVGVIPYKTDQKVLDTYPPLFEYVAEKSQLELEFSLVPESELGYRLDQGEFDVGVFTVFPYLAAKTDFPELEVFASHLVGGKTNYKGAILTTKSSNVAAITDLQDKQLGFVKPTSTSGYHLPKSILEEYDISLSEEQSVFLGGHDKAIEALVAGEVDAIGIDLAGFSKVAHQLSDFNVLTSYEIPYHAYVFSPQLTKSVRDQLKDIMLEADKDPSVRALFQSNPLKINSWRAKNEAYYNSLRRYLREVRVKPHVNLTMTVGDQTKDILSQSGDILSLLRTDIEQEIKQSGRFDLKKDDPLHTLKIEVSLFAVEDLFHYQVEVEDQLAGKGDITLQAVKSALPKIVMQHFLEVQPILTELLQKEDEWFVTYGTDDGINIGHYEFEWVQANGQSEKISKDQVSISEKNLHFKELAAAKGDQLKIIYLPAEIQDDGSEILITPSHNIFSAKFWRQDYWDKLGLILGVVFAIISALIGRLFSKRRQRRFKTILYQTNELLKDFLDDHLKFEARVIAQKEQISRLFENGTINENQFMILNNRIEEVSMLMDRITPQEVRLTDAQKEEIEDIIVDGKITEKEFGRIMNILRKS
ncbi:MAG: PhnD/SsuA/transferrin family substrate-binding protein [Cytophagales bacterium]|nr:PhnD/SsuA/transferrin family substrate-binding protein [Cytophagales bacterium]